MENNLKRTIIFFLVFLYSSYQIFPSDYLAPAGVSDTGFGDGMHALLYEPFKSKIKDNNGALFALLSNFRTPAVMEMTDALAGHSDVCLPEKKLNIYFPFSEWDTSVILPALELIERGEINKASIICAYVWELEEVKKDIISSIKGIKKFIGGLKIEEKNKKEMDISFTYHKKPVHITIYENNPVDALDVVKENLNLLYFSGFREVPSIDIVAPMWEKFIQHCRDRAAVFTYRHDSRIFDLISDWHAVTKNKFSDFGNKTGAVFELNKNIDDETLVHAWEAFEEPALFTKDGAVPSDKYDNYICGKAVAILNSLPEDAIKGPLGKMAQLYLSGYDDLPSSIPGVIEKFKIFFSNSSFPSYGIKEIGELLKLNYIILSLDIRLPDYFFIHLSAVMCRNKGINLNQKYSDRLNELREKMYKGDNFAIEEIGLFITALLDAGEDVDASFIVESCGELPEQDFDKYCDIIKRAPVEGLINHISDEAVKILDKEEKKKLHAWCAKLLMSFENIPRVKEMLAERPAARHNFFKEYMKYLYKKVESKKIPGRELFIEIVPDEKLLRKLVIESIMLVFCDIDRILSYMYAPVSEPDIVHAVKPELIHRIFIPLLRAIEMVVEEKGIVLTGEQKEMLDMIFIRHSRIIKKTGLFGHERNIRKDSNRRLIYRLKEMFKGDKDAENVIKWMCERPRHLFVPIYAEWWAEMDTALYLGRGQTISQPYIVVEMIKYLKLKHGQRVLEIGSGSGWASAIMARLVYVVFPFWWGHVYAIEYDKILAQFGKRNIKRLPWSQNVTVYEGMDGGLGLQKKAPFDAIMVSCGVPMDKAEEFVEYIEPQLKIGGRMIMPVTIPDGSTGRLYLFEKIDDKGHLQQTDLDMKVFFVPMRGRFGHDTAGNKSAHQQSQPNKIAEQECASSK